MDGGSCCRSNSSHLFGKGHRWRPTRLSSRRTLTPRRWTFRSKMLVFRAWILLRATCAHLRTRLPEGARQEKREVYLPWDGCPSDGLTALYEPVYHGWQSVQVEIAPGGGIPSCGVVLCLRIAGFSSPA